MANEEQLELIKQGVDPWNRWKRQHADKANLSGVNFSKAYLYGADLKKRTQSQDVGCNAALDFLSLLMDASARL
jgi:uncharacterized protein YjbI with pentapeptide repeats